ncbi:hypothetical protein BX600DRAFT_443028 [Xylariales sp. PMI_506]|nr:hypothetical protein BX600DRAFT_443028 [Xylariales sp. PMI_506]
MGCLHVLSDGHVRALLLSMSRADVETIARGLGKALTDFSVADPASSGGAAAHQAARTVRTRANGDVNLFMPAMSATAMASKLLGVPGPESCARDPQRTAPRGAMLLLGPQGDALAVVAAEELTAFRTALAALLLLPRRKEVGEVVVFGAGKQAVWHVRLALLLRPGEVRRITVVNRSAARTRALLQELAGDERAEENKAVVIQAAAEGLAPGSPEYVAEVERLVAEADVLFCTTPATAPLFDPKAVLEAPAAKRSKYITAIGSYKPNMLELDPTILQRAVADGKRIIVDTREGALEEAGELIQGGIGGEKLLELGELLDNSGRDAVKSANASEEWLSEGLVIYKGVGCGVMDVSVAELLLPIAREKNIGVSVDGF